MDHRGERWFSRTADAVESPKPPSHAKRSNKFSHSTVQSPRTYVPRRPTLLTELETYLSNGLDQLSKDDLIPTEDWLSIKRLKVYREAFQMFIDEFNIYKPFLSAVKYEYESTLDYFSGRARNYLTMKTDLVAKEREFTQKLKIKESLHEDRVLELNQEINVLQRQLAEKDRNLNVLQTQIDVLNLTAGRTDSDIADVKQSCLTLTAALNRLEDEKKKLAAKDTSKQAEILTLKVSLQKANNDLERLRLQLHDLESEQSSMVPLDVVEKHLSRIQEQQDQLKLREAQHKHLIQRYSLLKNSIEKAFATHNSRLGDGKEYISMNKFDWTDKKIARQVGEALERCKSDPRQIVEVLLDNICSLQKEIADGKEEDGVEDGLQSGIVDDENDGIVGLENKDKDDWFDSPWTHFEGLGLDPSVPIYLRAVGRVQNLNFSKKETEVYLNEIWIAKEAYEAELQKKNDESRLSNPQETAVTDIAEISVLNPGKIHLKDFFNIFLEQKFKTTARAVEFAYNYLDALKKYDFDSDCRLFLMIMAEELPEEIRFDQLALLNNLIDEFQREESTIRQPIEGRLPVDSFMRALRRVIPTKGEHALRRLEKALDLEIKGRKYVLYNEILEEDEQGNQGKFCETLRIQHLTECTTFANHVMDIIEQFLEDEEQQYEEDEDRSSNSSAAAEALAELKARKLRISRLREALIFSDPDNSRAGVNKLLARGCGVSVEDMLLLETRKVYISVDTFKQNLRRGLLKKSYPGTGGDQARGKLQY